MKSLHNRFLCAAAVALALVTAHAQAATVLWTGSTSNVWNTSAANWSGAPTYTSGDIVQFGDTGGANLGISINPAVTPASVTFTDTGAGTNAYTFSTAAINGTGTTVTLDSGFGGSAQFNVSNGYTGATTINGGRLIYNNNVTTASASHLIASGATLELNGTRNNLVNTTFSGAGTILKTGVGTTAWGGSAATFALGAGSLIDVQSGTFQGGSGSNEVWTSNLSDLNVASSAIFLGAEASVRVNKITGNGTIQTRFSNVGSITVGVDNGSSQFDGVIANGSGQTGGVLTKEGTGTITLTGSNTYNGTTNIRNGTIILVGDNRLAAAGAMVLGNTTTSGKLVLGNGTALSQTLAGLTITGLGGAVVGGAAANSTLTLNIATGTNTFGGNLGGNGTNENNLALIKSGAGNLTLSADSTYIGGTTLNGGILSVGNATSLGAGMVTLNGGTFNNSAGVTIANAINVAGTTALYSVGGNNFSLSGSVTGNGTINTGGSLGGASSLTFTNTDLSGFTGTITHDNVLDKNNTQFSLPLNTTAKFSTTGTTVTNSRSLLFAGGTIGELSGTGGSVRLNGTLNVNQSTNTTYAGVIFNNGGLQKSGNGTLTLSNTNLYTGATAVNAGTLIISGSISDSSALTVAAGAQLRYNSASARTGALTLSGNGSASRAVLGGTGSINTAITLNNLGDTLSPGNSPGQQAYGVNQTWNSLTYLWEVNNFTGTTAGTDFDQINITGNLTLSGGLNAYQLDITSLTGLNANGNVGNFSEVNRSWTILTTTTGIVGFNAANWTLLTTNFTSSPAYLGTFSLAQANNNLVLSYAVPEPTTWGLLALSLTTVVVFRRRRR